MSALPTSPAQPAFGSKGVAGTTRRSDQPRHDDLQRDAEQQHDHQHGQQQQGEQHHPPPPQQQRSEQDRRAEDGDDLEERRSQVPFMSLYAVHVLW